MIEPENSLTLDTDALTRAANALSGAISGRRHDCDEHNDGDGCCRVCWEIAAEIIRAAEGLHMCPRCNGMGNVDGGGAASCCPECGGDGLEPLSTALRQNRQEAAR